MKQENGKIEISVSKDGIPKKGTFHFLKIQFLTLRGAAVPRMERRVFWL